MLLNTHICVQHRGDTGHQCSRVSAWAGRPTVLSTMPAWPVHQLDGHDPAQAHNAVQSALVPYCCCYLSLLDEQWCRLSTVTKQILQQSGCRECPLTRVLNGVAVMSHSWHYTNSRTLSANFVNANVVADREHLQCLFEVCQ